MDPKQRGFRVTIGGLLIAIALIAIVFVLLRPKTTKIVDLKVGTGAIVKKGDTVQAHYVGQLTNGTVFDESKPKGQPIEFIVGQGTVIKGWDVGLLDMKVGGIRQLTIPPEEGYGKTGAGNVIPPNSTLVFEIELLGIK